MKSYFLGALFLFFTLFVRAQNTDNRISIAFHYGRVVKNNYIFPSLPQNSPALEVAYSQKVTGKKPWHSIYHYPEVGVSFLWINLGNPDVLGQAFSIAPHFSQDLITRKKIRFQYTLGASLGYVTKPYNRISNPTNNVLGSHLNNYSFAQGTFFHQISPQMEIYYGLRISHLSNGNTAIPNLGINIPTATIGVKYHFVSMADAAKTKDSLPSYPNKKPSFSRISPSFRVAVGITEKGTAGSPKYPIYLASFSLNSVWHNQLRLKVGTEWFYASGAKELIDNQQYPLSSTQNAVGGIVYVGGEFLIGKVGLLAQAGPYIMKPYQMNHLLYTKLGFQFYLQNQNIVAKNQPFIGVYVHSHTGEADFTEVGFGWNF
jgi:hypothetical protein